MARQRKPLVPAASADLVEEPQDANDLPSSKILESIRSHLGGQKVLTQLGVTVLAADHDHVSFHLNHPSPKGVRTVVISIQPRGLFNMDCYGSILLGALSAHHIGGETQIIPENLATVLGELTGIEELHHRHF